VFAATTNPLLDGTGGTWDALIEAVAPASLLVVIESRMSRELRRLHTPEDILQEALLHAWRDRTRFEWRGLKSFRSWLLTLIDNRIREAADRSAALKRGGGREAIAISTLAGGTASESGSAAGAAWPARSTTPSRVAVFREQAAGMRTALAELPADVRDVVRLRLFEQLSIGDIAARLGLGESAVRHRFRQGAEMYHRRLRAALASRASLPSESAPLVEPNSSPVE